MTGSARRRYALFLAVCAVLIAVAISTARAPRPAGPPPAPPTLSQFAPSSAALSAADDARREEARLRVVGRRFVSAFLRFEVGDLSSAVRTSLRSTAAPTFARQLLAAPPRREGRPAVRARIERIDVSFLAKAANRALLNGVARRAEGPEEFAFLFARLHGHWLALGAAE